jgi:hypothetical protein
MIKDALKYLEPNACVPIDMATTSMLVNALKEALAEHAMQQVQRLGQEIEQEPVAECPNLKGESMNKDEALTLEALKFAASKGYGRIVHEMKIAPFTIKYEEALAQPEQEPVAWLLTDKNINSIQVDSIQRLINRLNHAHHTDIRVRINGQDEWFEADWLKHMVRVTPPQRTEHNFCARCGKRTKDMTHIHTCTPPQENT